MTQTAPESAPTLRYFAIHADLGDGEPRALFRVNNGIYEWWTGQEGDQEWVDTPALAMYGRGEPGARLITEDEAEQLKTTLSPPQPGGVAIMRGTPEGRTDMPQPADETDTESAPTAGASVEDDQ